MSHCDPQYLETDRERERGIEGERDWCISHDYMFDAYSVLGVYDKRSGEGNHLHVQSLLAIILKGKFGKPLECGRGKC